jgi:uncharacterized protein (DUF58 family)
MENEPDELELEPRIRVVGAMLGHAPSRRRGRSTDVVGARPYVPGDDIRSIDWAASARISAASGLEQLVVREFHSEEAPTVAVAIDGSPSMQRFAPPLPWLHKPAAVATCVRTLALAAAAGRSQLGVLDARSWLAPRHRLPHDVAAATANGTLSLDDAFDALDAQAHVLPPGTFVFHISDFPQPPRPAVLEAFAELEWQLVPVVVRDPLWEQSYPVVTAGVTIPVAGDDLPRRLSRGQAEALRETHETDTRLLLDGLQRAGFPAALIGSATPTDVVASFAAWSEACRDLR